MGWRGWSGSRMVRAIVVGALVGAMLPGVAAARDPEPLPGVRQVTAGDTHTCALMAYGLTCWGDNDRGRLGNGLESGSLAAPIAPPPLVPDPVVTPPDISEVLPFLAFDAGTFATCAIGSIRSWASAGRAWCWGSIPLGRVCIKDDADSLFGPGLVMAGPRGAEGTPAECGTPLEGVAQVAVGTDTACALIRPEAEDLTGAIWCWGATGRDELLAMPRLLADGTALDGLRTIDGSGDRYCGIAEDATVWCWDAYSEATEAAQVMGLGPAVAVAVGRTHACAQVLDGGVWCWGDNDRGQLGDGTTIRSETPVQVAGLAGTTAMTPDPTEVPPWTRRILGVGDGGGCVLRDPGSSSEGASTAWCWGANDRGQLGDGSRDTRSGAVKVTGLDPALGVWDLAVGGSHACVVTGEENRSTSPDPTMGGLITDRSLRCWGAGGDGQLGAGDWSDRSNPTLVVMTEEPRLGE